MNILVIGAGSDIGKQIAIRLSTGNIITGTYYNSPIEAGTCAGNFFQCNLTSKTQICNLIHQVPYRIGLIVTAAMPFIEGDSFDYNKYLEIEAILRGHIYLLCQLKQQEKLSPDCRIINMLGQCVERGIPGAAFYSAAFAFLHNWGHSVNGKEGKAGEISVCDLLLGPVDTREWANLSTETLARYSTRVKQFLTVEDVADAVHYISNMEVMPSTFKWDSYYGY